MPQRHSNRDPAHRPHGTAAILRWGIWDRLLGRRRVAAPGNPAPQVAPDLDLIHRDSRRPRLTWIGHAAFLLQVGGRSILIDPVFSLRVGWIYRRHGEPGLLPRQLPPLDAVLVTHNHYDHLDLPSLRALPQELPLFVPSGLGAYLRRRVPQVPTELKWWQTGTLGDLGISLVPARHWSRRGILDTNETLWGGFVVQADGACVFHAGDTAWFDGFDEIARRFPSLLAALLPIGGYRPAWFMEHHHMNPEQAGEAFRILGARWLVPMHWGTLQLTDEPLSEPAERLRAWWCEARPAGRRLAIPAVGETIVLED